VKVKNEIATPLTRARNNNKEKSFAMTGKESRKSRMSKKSRKLGRSGGKKFSIKTYEVMK